MSNKYKEKLKELLVDDPELEELKKKFTLDTSVPEEYNEIMNYIKENTKPKETGIRNKMAIWLLNAFGKSIEEQAAILNLKSSTIKNYRYELIRKGLITKGGNSLVDTENTSVDICLKILVLKDYVEMES